MGRTGGLPGWLGQRGRAADWGAIRGSARLWRSGMLKRARPGTRTCSVSSGRVSSRDLMAPAARCRRRPFRDRRGELHPGRRRACLMWRCAVGWHRQRSGPVRRSQGRGAPPRL